MLPIPFVENAFKHGVGMVQDPSIEIELNDDKKSLFFSVSNKVSKQNSEIKDGSSGIGLANVRRRLELLYPDQHDLTISEKEDRYLVELKIKHT
jgi:LytS/YehU family sensor histidine kinase